MWFLQRQSRRVGRVWILLVVPLLTCKRGDPSNDSPLRFDPVLIARGLVESLLACAVYADLKPIRAVMDETWEGSDHTAVWRQRMFRGLRLLHNC